MKLKRKIVVFCIISIVPIIAFVILLLIFPIEHCTLTEQEWYKINTEKLKAYKPSVNELQTAKRFEKQQGVDLYTVYYRREGLIRIGETSWIYIKSHSFHDHDDTALFFWKLKHLYIGKYFYFGSPSKVYVSDAILAIDSNGRLYKNKGHVCSGVDIGSEQEIKTIEDFFSNTFAFNDSKWESIE